MAASRTRSSPSSSRIVGWARSSRRTPAPRRPREPRRAPPRGSGPPHRGAAHRHPGRAPAGAARGRLRGHPGNPLARPGSARRAAGLGAGWGHSLRAAGGGAPRWARCPRPARRLGLLQRLAGGGPDASRQRARRGARRRSGAAAGPARDHRRRRHRLHRAGARETRSRSRRSGPPALRGRAHRQHGGVGAPQGPRGLRRTASTASNGRPRTRHAPCDRAVQAPPRRRRGTMSLRRQIRTVAIAPTLALVAAVLAVIALEGWRVGTEVQRQVGALARGQLARAVEDFRLTCETVQAELERRLAASLTVAEDVLARSGGFAVSDQLVSWHAVNQADGAAREVMLRSPLLGGRLLERNADPTRPSPLVDEVQRLTGAAATLFVRMDEEGDMLRVATSVRDRTGARAVGTYLEARGADGPNPVVAAVLRGERYVGRAFVVDAWYLTTYQPLRGAGGRVEGMLFVGLRQDGLESLRRAADSLRIGESGSLMVIGAKGSQRGRLVMGSGAFKAGEDLSSLADPESGRSFIKDLLERAPALPAGTLGQDRWIRPAAGAGAHVPRLASYGYFAPWDWLILGAIDEAEATSAARAVHGSLVRMGLAAAVLALAAILGAVLYARRAAVRIAGPVEAMAVAAEGLAQGDLGQRIDHTGDDEVGRLAEAFRRTMGYLREVADGAEALAHGDLSRALVPRSKDDHLARRFIEVQDALRALIEETERLGSASEDGSLSVRADPD